MNGNQNKQDGADNTGKDQDRPNPQQKQQGNDNGTQRTGEGDNQTTGR